MTNPPTPMRHAVIELTLWQVPQDEKYFLLAIAIEDLVPEFELQNYKDTIPVVVTIEDLAAFHWCNWHQAMREMGMCAETQEKLFDYHYCLVDHYSFFGELSTVFASAEKQADQAVKEWRDEWIGGRG